MQERYNSIANALELCLSCTNPYISCSDATILYPSNQHINGLAKERCNSIANALELRLSCTNPSISCSDATILYPGNQHINVVVQERCHSISNALESHCSCTNPLISLWLSCCVQYSVNSSPPRTKWLPFCRRYVQTHFLEWRYLNFKYNFIQMYSLGPDWQYVSAGSDNGLAPGWPSSPTYICDTAGMS